MTGGRLNLCVACRNVKPDAAAGMPRATRALARALAQEGHAVHLVTDASACSAPPDLPGVAVVPVIAAPASGRFADPLPDTAPDNLLHAAAVYREVRRIHQNVRPVDAVLAPLWRSEGAVCALDDRFPTVVSCMTSLNTLIEVDPAYRQIEDIDERLGLEREALRRTRFLHGLTGAVLTKTIGDHQLTPEATTVIGRGLQDWGVPARAADPGAPVRVLFVGRLEHRKGVDVLLEAARELIEAEGGVEFTLAGPNGDPRYRAEFEQLAAQRPALRAAVRFTGRVPDADLVRLYTEADIVCLPSRYESHGIVLLEAMMAGKPILTTDAGGIGEVITAGRDALAVAPDDAPALAAGLRRLIADPRLRARLGAAARETFATRFDAQATARRMQAFIQEVGVLHAARRAPSSDVGERLQSLLAAALGLDSVAASRARHELLHPSRDALQRASFEPERRALRAELVELRGERDHARAERDGLRAELACTTATLQSHAATLTALQRRDEILGRIEAGGWWRLRARLLPLLRLAARLRRSTSGDADDHALA